MNEDEHHFLVLSREEKALELEREQELELEFESELELQEGGRNSERSWLSRGHMSYRGAGATREVRRHRRVWS